MKDLRTICVLVVLLALAGGIAYSQAVNATLLGTVTDVSGAIVPNAKVLVTEVNTGVTRSGQSNERKTIRNCRKTFRASKRSSTT